MVFSDILDSYEDNSQNGTTFFVDLFFCRMERTSFENHIKTTYVEQKWEKAVKNNKILEDILCRIDSWHASPQNCAKNTFLCVPCAFSCGPSSGTTAKLLLDLNRCATATFGKPDANQKHSCSHKEEVKTTKNCCIFSNIWSHFWKETSTSSYPMSLTSHLSTRPQFRHGKVFHWIIIILGMWELGIMVISKPTNPSLPKK